MSRGLEYARFAIFLRLTLAPVGYGDFAPTKLLARIFTMLYIINGLGDLVAFVDVAASERLGQIVTEVPDDLDRNAR